MRINGMRAGRAVLIAVGMAVLFSACAGGSVSMGVAVPAPWGSVTVQTHVPIGHGW